jgi:hypothetical protein
MSPQRRNPRRIEVSRHGRGIAGAVVVVLMLDVDPDQTARDDQEPGQTSGVEHEGQNDASEHEGSREQVPLGHADIVRVAMKTGKVAIRPR